MRRVIGVVMTLTLDLGKFAVEDSVAYLRKCFREERTLRVVQEHRAHRPHPPAAIKQARKVIQIEQDDGGLSSSPLHA
jgi:hypothetical protein